MSPIYPEEIASAAADFESELMPDTATVFEEVTASDGQGGKTTKLQPRAADVPVGYGPLKQRGGDAEGEMAAGQQAVARWLFRMPKGTAVHPTDVVVVDGDPTEFRVEALRSPRGFASLMCRFEAIVTGVGGPAAAE